MASNKTGLGVESVGNIDGSCKGGECPCFADAVSAFEEDARNNGDVELIDITAEQVIMAGCAAAKKKSQLSLEQCPYAEWHRSMLDARENPGIRYLDMLRKLRGDTPYVYNVYTTGAKPGNKPPSKFYGEYFWHIDDELEGED